MRPEAVAAAAAELAAEHELVLIEGAGGLLVRFDDTGGTLADAAAALSAPVLVVVHAGLGTLNVAALTAEALSARGLQCAGAVIGSWPAAPDLAARCNVVDLPEVLGAPLLGAMPEGSGEVTPEVFRSVAQRELAPELGGSFNAVELAR
ncbi:dethiobiotin synthetase [Saccharopolyspora phatthalungensis]|uniref:Dethiobiotin synthetase n=1 Tax=Saccharopolyspora phatthalungensis TaxID=664693 RepID=A0A840Q1M1_9PSEU|nr:dethiobiotin synthetase [Saccharopolyspora phatthalungensis]